MASQKQQRQATGLSQPGRGRQVRKGDRGRAEGGMLPCNMGVQVPQGLRGVGGGIHAGNWLIEGVASCFLGLDAASSPAFSVQPLGDVLKVPNIVQGPLATTHLFLRPAPPFTTNHSWASKLFSPLASAHTPEPLSTKDILTQEPCSRSWS